jgi:endonuclease G
MPGVIDHLSFRREGEDPATLNAGRIVLDVSTMGGTGGAPVIDAATGKLIGINYGGEWDDKALTKFAYAIPVGRIPEDPIALFKDAPTVAARCREAPVELPVGDRHQLQEELESLAGYDPDFLGKSVPLPTHKGSGRPLNYLHFSILMADDRQLPRVTAVNLDGKSMVRVARKADAWTSDPRLAPDKQPNNRLYADNELDRGNLVRRTDPAWGDLETARKAEQSTYYFTNSTPQHANFNQRAWAHLEDYVSDFAERTDSRVSIFTGPVLAADDPVYRGFRLPQAFWKVVVAAGGKDAAPQAAAFLLPHTYRQANEQAVEIEAVQFDPILSRTTVKEIERLTGLDFGAVSEAKELF